MQPQFSCMLPAETVLTLSIPGSGLVILPDATHVPCRNDMKNGYVTLEGLRRHYGAARA